MLVRYALCLLVSIALQGCDQAKDSATALISEATKSSAQRSAEDGCWKAAVNAEARRTKDFRALVNGPMETTTIGGGHFLVKVTYKKITLEDTGQHSNNDCMYAYTTCEIRNGAITTVIPSTSFCDSFVDQKGSTPSPQTVNKIMSENDRLEDQKVTVAINELEARYPELNENSPRYDQQLVNRVLTRQKIYIAQGMAPSNALRQAVAEYFR